MMPVRRRFFVPQFQDVDMRHSAIGEYYQDLLVAILKEMLEGCCKS